MDKQDLGRLKNAYVFVSSITDIPVRVLDGEWKPCKFSPGYQGPISYLLCDEVVCGRYVLVVGVFMNSFLSFHEMEIHGWL